MMNIFANLDYAYHWISFVMASTIAVGTAMTKSRIFAEEWVSDVSMEFNSHRGDLFEVSHQNFIRNNYFVMYNTQVIPWALVRGQGTRVHIMFL